MVIRQKIDELGVRRSRRGRQDWDYGMAGGDGTGETEGGSVGLTSTGGTDGSSLSSCRTAFVAELNVAVDPARTESGFGTAPGSPP